MSQIARFRRLLLHNRPNTTKGRTFPCSRFSTLTHKEPTPQCTPKETVASSASAVDHPIPTSSTTPPSPPPPEIAEKKPWGFLKFGIFGALTGAVGMAGYATYAYSLEEVDYKTRAIRESPNYSVANDASAFEGMRDPRPSPLELSTSIYPSKNQLHYQDSAVEGLVERDLRAKLKFQALVYSTAMKVPAKSIELYLDLRKLIEEHVRGFTEPMSDKLLPDLLPQEQHVFTLVLDLNETLVYSDWKRERGWRTFKRPGVDAFLEHLAQFYEIVVYSDQMAMYVEPIIDRLDQHGCIRYRLSRAATRYQDGRHYRDLSKLNRDPSRILYVSGHALESCLQPENAVPVKPWTLEADDTALLDLIPFLEFVARSRPADIRQVLSSFQGRDIASEFIERSKAHQRRMQEQKKPGLLWRR